MAPGLACLFVAEMNDISGVGVIGAIGIAATLLTMLTLFPAALVSLGRKVFWPRVPAFGSNPPPSRGGLGAGAGPTGENPPPAPP